MPYNNSMNFSLAPVTKLGTVFLAFLVVGCIPELQETAAAPPRIKQQDAAVPSSVSPPQQETRFSAAELEDCLFVEPCLIGHLPPLGMEREFLEDPFPIMERVWSSEPWMKERFHQLLERLPPAYFQLFRPITAIAIAEDIHPSHYWPATGGIYLNPSFLWLTQQEKNTIADLSDPRGENLDDFPFRIRWRYVEDNDTDPFRFHAIRSKENRTLEQAFLPFAAMLTHELAHANDYLPPHTYELLNDMSTFYDAVFYGVDTYLHRMRVSTTLHDRFPISSQLIPVARSYYARGGTAKQSNRSASELGSSFAADAVSSFYSYTHRQEDLAMLFEEVMMKEFFDLDRDMAFTEPLQSENNTCNDYLVRWGTRNRFADPLVRERAEFVATQLFPDYDFTDLFEQVYDSSPLSQDIGWCDSIPSATSSTRLNGQEGNYDSDYDLTRYYQDAIDDHLQFILLPQDGRHSH